ncbi:MAG: dephospho-CoA kinase [bacterium]|nr:dephospho-CoA kinase [bacterium]
MALKVALTGGLASGKSEVAGQFHALGAAVVDADAFVHDLYQANARGTKEVVRLFGTQVLAVDGRVDRGVLGRLVLAESQALDSLNRAIHPLVRTRVDEWYDTLDPQVKVAIVEASLVVETGAYLEYDTVVVVWCRPEQQLDRAVQRGMSRDRALALLQAQMPLDEKRKIADSVIDNSGDRETLELKVAQVWRELLLRAD